MKKGILAAGLALLTLVVVLLIHSPLHSPRTAPAINGLTAPAINGLYVFGDSLSDTGMVFQSTAGAYPPNPPYFEGRYSNGRVWVEYLADRLRLSPDQASSFAWGGARTGGAGSSTTSQLAINSFVPSLLTQTQLFIEAHPQVNPDTLYVLWAGANDYLQGETNPAIPLANTTKVLTALINAGATKFLVANLPDLGLLPLTRLRVDSEELSALTQSHNQGLQRSLNQLSQQHPDLQIATLEVNQLYQAAITNPPSFGFTTVTRACLSSTSVCDNPDNFLFWDSIHPTTAAHQSLGEAAFLKLQQRGMVAS